MAEQITPVSFHSTNNPLERVNFETALLKGQAPDYGLYTIDRANIPKLEPERIQFMKNMSYAEIAFEVLNPFLGTEIPKDKLTDLLADAYREDVIPTKIQPVTGNTHILWLTQGPTYSFKDYAARFFGRALDYFLEERGLRRTVLVATSGDTGGAVADALFGLANVDNVVFYPRNSVSEGQRKQMTTLGGNIHAVEVNGDFDVCQALVKYLLGDKVLHRNVLGDTERLTSANSISLGRLLPQMVYPFFAYSRIAHGKENMIASIPSGNFGDMMGTVIARAMGLPISKIICGVNENTEFPDFLQTGRYTIRPSVLSPSSAMIVAHPSNLARLIDFYGGHMYDARDKNGRVVREGIVDKMPDLDAMGRDIFSVGTKNWEHYRIMEDVYQEYGIILDPHGAVGWKTLEVFLKGKHGQLAVVYETADPGKFPLDVKEAIGITPKIPARMQAQQSLPERIYCIENEPDYTTEGPKASDRQKQEARALLFKLFGHIKASAAI